MLTKWDILEFLRSLNIEYDVIFTFKIFLLGGSTAERFRFSWKFILGS